MVRWFSAAVLIAVACGGSATPEGPPPADTAPPSGGSAPREPPGDPLLARARQGLVQGQLPDEVKAEILGSTEPQHARARRLLEAMAQPLAEDEPEPEPEPAGDTVAELRAPPLAVGDAEPAPASTGTPASTKPKPDRPRPPAPAPSAQVRVGKLSLRPTQRGAQLTIGAKGPIVVGVANQLSSGIVRLIIEKAQAEGALLSSRPRLQGAQVTAVRQGQGTIQITLRLDPGWQLGSVKSFPGGARVNLVSPR